MAEDNKTLSFEEILEQWSKAYAFCSVFELQYISGQVSEEEYQDFLTDKARLVVSLPQVLLTKCIEDKNEFDKEYIDRLYIRFFDQLDKDGIELTDFDKEYIDDIMNRLEEDVRNGVYRKKDPSEDE